MAEIITHGQELSSEFLDELFVSIKDKAPDRTWIEIKKNHERVVAGIKHMIDCSCFGAEFELVFNPTYAYFKKRVVEGQQRIEKVTPKSNFSQLFWEEQDRLKVEQHEHTIRMERKKRRRSR